MTLQIRHATAADAPAVAAIYRPIVLDTSISFEMEPPDAAEMAARIKRIQATHVWLVAEDAAGALAGYAYASPFRARAAYHRTCETTVYVAASHQRRGVGRELMERLLDEVRGSGHHLAIAGVTPAQPKQRCPARGPGLRARGHLQ